MALKVDYVAREVGSNLRRNVTLTLASVITVFVSLALVGVAFLTRTGVQNATQRWQGGVEFIVFMQPAASEDQISAVQEALDESPQVDSVDFIDQQEAYEEFTDLFADSPEMIQSVTPEILPPSFRVEPTDKDVDVIRALGSEFESKPGVKQVVFAAEAIRTLQDFSRLLSLGLFSGALVLLGAAVLLILNAIRMAMFARRREIEVMKLVGATNWFIRVPFMVEGLVQGLVGALLAIPAVIGIINFIESKLTDTETINLFQGFAVHSSEQFGVAILLLVVGCLVGVIGSFVAVTRFLDV
ncbi:MAG: ABC transporter permease [Acidimicrobiales bacterium]|nr:ABC transporter permease [Acidimicrobiales bacterium]MCB9373811.1 ABC transporter permease [Microthrixaceae bacterium]